MKSKNGKPAAKFQVGDRVQFQLGRDKVWGTITEDHGPIGFKSRRLYTIRMPMDPYEAESCSRGEEELEPDTISRVPLEKSEIIGFLKNSGLVAMLISSPWSEQKDSLLWLCRGPNGTITYTFSPRHGLIGGQFVPDSALGMGDKIDARKKDEVAEFLLSFGLTREEAEAVIRTVGTSPVRKPRRRKAKST